MSVDGEGACGPCGLTVLARGRGWSVDTAAGTSVAGDVSWGDGDGHAVRW